jgi:signal peptidase I
MNYLQDISTGIELKELTQEILHMGHSIRMAVKGLSMLPTLKEGDFVIFKSVTAKELFFGDLIVYKQQQKFIIHRYIKTTTIKGKIYLKCKGDNLLYFDPLIPKDELLGKVFIIEKNESRISLTSYKSRGMNMALCCLYVLKGLFIKGINRVFRKPG